MLTLGEDVRFYQLLLLKLGNSLIEKRFKLLFRASEHAYNFMKSATTMPRRSQSLKVILVIYSADIHQSNGQQRA